MNRRSFLGVAANLVPLDLLADSAPIPIIDTHIHLFDPTRPQGVPWPPKSDPVLYKPALPERYTALAEPLGIVGAIEIEASPWIEDNQWVLDLAKSHPLLVGAIGNLEPGQPEFRRHLDHFRKNQLFRGIRYGNLWNRNLAARLSEHNFLSDLQALADAQLVLDTANPDPALINAVVRLTDTIPDLRVVIDHLPHLQIPTSTQERTTYEANLNRLAQRPQIYVKVSEVLQRVNGKVPLDENTYRPVLDHLWDTFGPDRLLYGSDWPNSDLWGTYAQVVSVVRPYFMGKGRANAEKYFWKNSIAAYHWVKRKGNQPTLTG